MSLAQKIKSWIDSYIDKIRKAFERLAPHSEEAQLLTEHRDAMQEIQKLWDSALKNAARNSRTLGTIETDGGVQFSFGVTQDEINDYVEKAKIKGNEKDYKKYAKVTDKLLSDVSEEIDLKGYSHALRDNDIRHILNSHGETTNEKYPVTLDDIKAIPYIVENYDKVLYKTNDKGQPGVIYIKVGSNNVVYYVEAITEKYGSEKLLINKQMIKTGFENIPKLFGLKTAITKKQTEFEFLSDLLQIRKAYAQSEYQNQPVNNSIPNPDKNVKQKSLRTNELIEKYPSLNLNQDISDLDGVPAIRLVDGSVLPLDTFNGRRMLHVEYIQKNKIDFQDIESGGWIGNGEYEPSFTSDTQRYLDRMSAKKQVADLTGKSFEQFKQYSLRDTYDDTKALAKDLKKELKSSLTVTELDSYMKYLVDTVADIESSVDFEAFRETVGSYAEAFVDSSNVTESVDSEQRKAMSDYFKGMRFKMTPELRVEVTAQFGSYQSFSRKMFGKDITFSDKAEYSLDSYWSEIVSEFPDVFREDENAYDQPQAILDAFDGFRNAEAESAEGETEERIEWLTNKLVEFTSQIFRKQAGTSINPRTYGTGYSDRELLA